MSPILHCLLGIVSFGVAVGVITIPDIMKLQTSEIFEDVKHVGIIVGIDDDDEVMEEAAKALTLMSNLDVAFLMKPTCSGLPDASNWVFLDLSEMSQALVNTTKEDFGRCKWLFERSMHNLKHMERIGPPYDSRVFLWNIEEENASTNTISEVYTLSSTSKLYENLVAKYNNSTDLMFEARTIWHRRSNLDGIRLRATLVHAPNAIIIPKNDLSRAFGMAIEILKFLEKTFNFTSERMLPKEGLIGIMDKNGSWDGMMKQLVNDDADISLMMQLTKQRSDYVEFYHSFAHTGVALVTRRTDLAAKFSFIALLDIPVWIAGSVTIVIFMVYAVVVDWTRRDREREPGQAAGVVIYVYASLINQSPEEIYKRLSMRIFLITLLMFAFLGLNFLSANLTSFMSVKREADDIKTLEDVEAKGLELFIPGGSKIEQDFATARVGTAQRRLWDNQISTKEIYRSTNHIAVVSNFLSSKKGALLVYTDVIRNWIPANKVVGCSLRQVSLDNANVPLSFASRKGFRFFEAFNEVIKKMVETGLARRMVKEYQYNFETSQEYVCSSIETDPDLAIGMDGTRFFFFLLAVGMGLAVVTFVLERTSCKKKKEATPGPKKFLG